MSTIRLCIVAPVGTDAYNARLLQAITPVLPPDVSVSVRNLPPEQARDCIQDRVDWLRNGYPVVALARTLQQEGFDGIWLSDFDMCGVEAAREAVDIPIIGGFSSSALTALALSQRFSIITILQSTVAMQYSHVLGYGLQHGFASIRAIDCPVAGLDEHDIVVERVFAAALQAVRDDGAQSILLGCTGMMGVAAPVAARLEQALGSYVPVIDPNQAGFSMLLSLVRMRLRPSRRCYSPAR